MDKKEVIGQRMDFLERAFDALLRWPVSHACLT